MAHLWQVDGVVSLQGLQLGPTMADTTEESPCVARINLIPKMNGNIQKLTNTKHTDGFINC